MIFVSSTLLVQTDTSLVQIAEIEPARFIQPQDFKNNGIFNSCRYLTLVNTF